MLEVQPLTPHIGAVVRGVDLPRLTDDEFADLREGIDSELSGTG